MFGRTHAEEKPAVRAVAGGLPPMIRLQNVEKFFEVGAGKSYVLRRIKLDVREGEFVTFMGPSGAGKSTLLSILGMLDGAWAGEYFLYDHVVHKLSVKEHNNLHK